MFQFSVTNKLVVAELKLSSIIIIIIKIKYDEL